MIAIDEIMTSDVVCITKDKSVGAAARVMSEKHIGCLIVVEQEGRLSPVSELGIITERDLLKKVVAKNLKPDETKVSGVMSRPLITVETKTPIHEVSKIMDESNIRRIGVVENNTLIGVVTTRDTHRKYRTITARRLVHGKYDKDYAP